MTKQLVEFTLDDGASIVFETDQAELNSSMGGRELINRKAKTVDKIEKASQSLSQVAAKIRPAAETVLQALKELNTPKEIQMEFGVKLNASTGVILASANSEVNFKVTLKWENDKDQ